MTESVAICDYLAVRHGPSPLAVAPHEADFGAYLNWLHHGEATLTFPQTLVLRYARFEPAERRQPQVADDYARWFLARLRGLDARLSQSETLCAGRFTAADISVGYALHLAEKIGLSERMPPAVLAYGERLKQREGYQRAVQAEHDGAKAAGFSASV
jgi:glutathione S-transferase